MPAHSSVAKVRQDTPYRCLATNGGEKSGLVPSLGALYIATTQANELTTVLVSLTSHLDSDGFGIILPEWVPFRERLQGATPQIVSKVGELAGFFVSSPSSVTRGTASFFMSLFVMLYAMAYFLQERISV